jgi:HPt (histidine-containing phosphotransfer) domain-containing protein
MIHHTLAILSFDQLKAADDAWIMTIPLPEPAGELRGKQAPLVLDLYLLRPLLDLYQQTQGESSAESLAIFFQYILDMLDKLNQAIQVENTEAIYWMAHGLKGSASSYGAAAFAAQCKLIEIATRQHHLDPSPEYFQRLLVEYVRLKRAILTMPERSQE